MTSLQLLPDRNQRGVRYLSFDANTTPSGSEMFYQDVINHTMARPQPLGGGNRLLGFLGVNGTPYALQSATNLNPPIIWTPLATNTANPTNGWV